MALEDRRGKPLLSVDSLLLPQACCIPAAWEVGGGSVLAQGRAGTFGSVLGALPRAGFSEGSWLPENRTPKCSGTGDSSDGQDCPLAGEAGRADPRRAGLSPQAVGQALAWAVLLGYVMLRGVSVPPPQGLRRSHANVS